MTDKISRFALYDGDCLDVMRGMEADSVDAIVTDPPYGLKFMAKKWDHSVPSVEAWEEALRVLKPGGHLLSFGGTRTYHRLVCAIEDAGFEIRDTVCWIYGSGFPKSLNVSKAIDKASGAKREVVGPSRHNVASRFKMGEPDKEHDHGKYSIVVHAPETISATDEAKQWDGWGTALKPAHEPIVLARKPLSEKTVAANVLKWGTGAINVDGCRVGTNDVLAGSGGPCLRFGGQNSRPFHDAFEAPGAKQNAAGRFPANFIWSHHPECVQVWVKKVKKGGGVSTRPADFGGRISGQFKAQSDKQCSHADADGQETVEDWDCHEDCPSRLFPTSKDGVAGARSGNSNGYGGGWKAQLDHTSGYGGQGSAARFFYCAKANKKDRNEGLSEGEKSNHPTVKPTDLMRYLCRLITPLNGIILDPYMGSGSTGKAAVLEGFRFAGIEQNEEYLAIAEKRITMVKHECPLFDDRRVSETVA